MKTFVTNNNKGDNYLLNRLMMAYPELIFDNIEEELPPIAIEYRKNEELRIYNPIEDEFEKALHKLELYKKNNNIKSLYDFRLPDGTPVKEYQNFIQVGFKLIPKRNYHKFFETTKNTESIQLFIFVINNLNL